MDMELYCAERLQDSQVAERDPTIFEDIRVLQNLLDLESLYIPSCNYFETIQKDLQPFMRKVVTTWMLEVCEEQRCEDQVFPLAVNFLDRFLCACAISRRQLQLAGAVCLLLASKLRQCHALSVDLLCAYTDHSISPADMRSWELLVLGKLHWEAVAVTGFDVADHVLARLTSASAPAPAPLRLHPLTRQHALTLVCFCYVEPEFIQSPPSLLAAASICAAVRGLHPGASAHVLASMAHSVCSLSRADPQATEAVIRHIERALAAEVANQQQQLPPQAVPLPGYTPAPGAAQQPTASAKMAGVVPEDPREEDRQPETPIDVQDVRF